MTKNAKHTICADHEWLSNIAKSVKEDKEVIMELAKRIKKTKRENRPVKEQVEDILSDAAYTQMVLKSDVDFTMTTMAKELGMTGAPSLQSELTDLGIIYRQGNVFHLTSEYSGYGLTAYRTHKGEQLMVWTQKGRVWLHNLVKRGLLVQEPKPQKKYVKHKKGKYSDERKPVEQITATDTKSVDVSIKLKPIRNTELLINLIEQMQGYFECVVSLAKDCLRDNDEADCRLLRGDIRSINDSTTLMMRQLESECYKMLASD